jgi:integrase
MPKRVNPLNAKQLEKWKPSPDRTLELVDGAVPGLRVRLAPNGEVSWSMNLRVQGTRRRIAIGRGLKLAEARRKAEEARLSIGRGEDPSEPRRAEMGRCKAAQAGVGTLGSVIAAYYDQGPGAALRSGAAQRALIERVFIDFLPRPALDVRLPDLQLAIDGWRSKSSAKHSAAYFRPLARWAAKRGLMAKGDPLEAPRQAAVKQRALTRDEVGALLRALCSRPHDLAATFMLLTAARRDEVCGATWREFSERGSSERERSCDQRECIWTIPAERRKDTRPSARRAGSLASLGRERDHVVTLSRQASGLVDALRGDGNADDGALVFGGERGAKLTNWARWSARMKRKLGFDVSPHALRRTSATLAGDLGSAPHVVSALLGHRSIGGSLHAGYNQSRYRAEVATALQMVADLMDAAARGEDNVIALRRA